MPAVFSSLVAKAKQGLRVLKAHRGPQVLQGRLVWPVPPVRKVRLDLPVPPVLSVKPVPSARPALLALRALPVPLETQAQLA